MPQCEGFRPSAAARVCLWWGRAHVRCNVPLAGVTAMPHGAAGCKATPLLQEQNGSWGCFTPTVSQLGERGSCPSSTIHLAPLFRAILDLFNRNASGQAGTDGHCGGRHRGAGYRVLWEGTAAWGPQDPPAAAPVEEGKAFPAAKRFQA